VSAGGPTARAPLPAFFSPHYLASVGSTSEAAKAAARDGAPEGTVIVADRQTAGHGRSGRGWTSPAGNVYASFVLRPGCPPAQAAQLSFVAALAVHAAVTAYVPKARVKLKWPNDVLVDGAKISGILLESAAGGAGAVDWVVIGIGINVASAPPDIGRATACIADAAGMPVSADACIGHLANGLEDWYGRWRTDGFAPVREGWLRHRGHQDGMLTVRLPNEEFTARFVDLDGEGALVVEAEGGQRRVTAGEVFLPGEEDGTACC
jgi:BirA family biotin operon repressor/biotin-[acetyl-CoA-carboxylase] ligase